MNVDRNKSSAEDFIPLERNQEKHQKNSYKDNLKEQREKRRQKRARIIVRNISYKATDDLFRAYFEKFGEIQDYQLLKKGDGKLVGCGFLQFETVNQAAKAILKANNTKFLGRPVIVDWALGKNEYEKKKELSIKKEIKTEDGQEVKLKNNPHKIKKEEICEDDYDNKNDINSEDDFKDSSDSEEEDSSKEDYMEVDADEDSESDKNDTKEKKNILKVEISKTKSKSNDIKEECTVFIKNVPFDATSDDLKLICRKFGPIYYAIINTDPMSGHSRGTAFVKYKTKESADLCLRAGEEFVLMDQILETLPALSREEVQDKDKKDDKNRDARNLYLIKEGLIMTGSKAAEDVSASDMAKRHKIEQVKAQVLKNLNRFVSRNRLSIHNLPLNYDDEKLKDMIIKHTKFKPHECRIIRENKPSVGYPKGKSKGFGFMSFKNHQEALMALRKLNNNPGIFGNQNRPIVGFSIEDRSVHNIKIKRLQKSRQNNPTYKEKLEKLKSKKLQENRKVNTHKDRKDNIHQKIKNKSNNKNKLIQNDNTINEDNFMGMPAKPGSFIKMRSNKKIREQSQEHKNKVSKLKRQVKKKKEIKEIRREKKSIDRPKQGKKKLQKDNFSLLVNKYKNLIDVKPKDGVKSKRTKWYTE